MFRTILATIAMLIALSVTAYSSNPNAPGALPMDDQRNGEYTMDAVCIPVLIPNDQTVILGDYWIPTGSNNAVYPLNPPGGVPMSFTLYGQGGQAQYTVKVDRMDTEVDAGGTGKIYLDSHWELDHNNPSLPSDPMEYDTNVMFEQPNVMLHPGDNPCDHWATITVFADQLEIEPTATPGTYVFVMKISATFDSF